MNPRSTDCEADALTTTPSRWFVRFCAFDVSRDAIGVVVFQRRPTDQVCDLPLALCHRRGFTISCIRLESNSTGSSFPADWAKPVALAVISLDSSQEQ